MQTAAPKKANPVSVAPDTDWHPAQILAALNMAGYTITSLAEHYQLSDGSSLSKALRNSSPAGEKRIAEVLDRHPKEIWPSRYEKDGTRKLVGFHALQSTRRRNSVNAKLAKMNSHESA
ncbi:helix-turn-helix domain-containing protein [Methylomonas sp. ZR1]|uniref:helix-turn-helix domain-containing protein n=1 Tax=Methylomonas sp. ZR1 TaxID=1797072 RepID=UPI001492129A|nr:helix-turn-helix domain-containing protein [Methylomonas sp. ZR1]NOV29211.1 transcriptional regulator [Methylomonas sp. ZR1]